MLRIQYGCTCVSVNMMGCRRHPSCRRYQAPDRHSAYPAMCGGQCTVHGVLVHTTCTPTIEGSHGIQGALGGAFKCARRPSVTECARSAHCAHGATSVCTLKLTDQMCTSIDQCAQSFSGSLRLALQAPSDLAVRKK
jgi:hypothetical protein